MRPTKTLLVRLLLTLLLLLCVAGSNTAAADKGPLQYIEDQYRALDNKGKFVATAAVAFVGTRVAISTVTGAIKWGLAAFITAEVLHHTGVMDDIPPLSEAKADMILNVKRNLIKTTEDFRVQVRRRFNRESVRHLFEKEKVGALGLATGALLGTLM